MCPSAWKTINVVEFVDNQKHSAPAVGINKWLWKDERSF